MATDIISAYRSVCRDLRGLEAYVPIVKRKLESAHGVVYKGRMPSSGSICYVPLTTSIPMYNEAVEDYNETVKTIQQLQTVKAQLEGLIAKMSEPEQMIISLQLDGRMTLRQIADKTNYSYDRLRHIAAGIKNKSVIESITDQHKIAQ